MIKRTIIGLSIGIPALVGVILGSIYVLWRAQRKLEEDRSRFTLPSFEKVRSPTPRSTRPTTATTNGARSPVQVLPPRSQNSKKIPSRTSTVATTTPSPQRPPRSLVTEHKTYRVSPSTARSPTPSRTSTRRQTVSRSSTHHRSISRSSTRVRTIPSSSPRVTTPTLLPEEHVAVQGRLPPSPPPLPPPKDPGQKPRRPTAPRRLRSSPADLYTLNNSPHSFVAKQPSSPIPKSTTVENILRRYPPPHIATLQREPSMTHLRKLSVPTRLTLHAQNSNPEMARTLSPHTPRSSTPPHALRNLTFTAQRPGRNGQLTPPISARPTLLRTQTTPVDPVYIAIPPTPPPAELEGCNPRLHIPAYAHHPDEAFDMISAYHTPSWTPVLSPPLPLPLPRHLGADEDLVGKADSPTLPRSPFTWFPNLPSPLAAISEAVRRSGSLGRTLSRGLSRKKRSTHSDADSPPLPSAIGSPAPLTETPISPEDAARGGYPVKDSPVSALSPQEHPSSFSPPVPTPHVRALRRVFEEVDDPAARALLDRRMESPRRGRDEPGRREEGRRPSRTAARSRRVERR